MEYRVGVIGLGYVGLPLAIESGKNHNTIGFDINESRIDALRSGHDSTKEIEAVDFTESQHLTFTTEAEDLSSCNFFIVTVPTPVDESKKPNLTPLVKASQTVSSVLKVGDIVVYESTVFPGCTEEVCVPILEQSGLKFNKDFYCGYSPERINPGDKKHRLVNIKKVTSGSTPDSAERIDAYYNSFIQAGTYKASSIKVAEAAKVIENSQRDINIAFVNELSLIFRKMNIDTLEVLEAAGTKWNFLPFKPGLVGGHCIGVDPYYLTHKAEMLGYNPQIILAGRRLNDGMGAYVAKETIKQLIKLNELGNGCKVLILGFTFKENCPDVRNTRVIDIYKELKDFNVNVDIQDPHANSADVESEYQLKLVDNPDFGDYQAVIVAVSHEEFKALNWVGISKKVPVVFDIKGILPKDLITSRL